MQNAVDLWIFIMNLSMPCLRLETLTARIDVDLWIFENRSIISQKVKVTRRKMQWICGFL